MTVETTDATRETVNSVQVLRAYAAISVLVGHVMLEWATNMKTTLWFHEQPLLAGVDIFFVISGFIMYYTSAKAFALPGAPRDFLVRRVIRVVPLYWLFTTLIILPLLLSPDALRSTKFDLGHVVTSYLFIPYEREGGRIAPVLSVGWTLNYEALFYGLFAIALNFRKQIALTFLFGSLIGLTVLGAFLPETAPAPLRFWSNGIILTFAMGALIGMAYERWGKAHAKLPLCLAVLALGFVLLFSSVLEPFPRFVSGGVPASLIVGAAVLLLPRQFERNVPAWLLLLGASSYALYLCHRFVLRVGSILVSRFHLDVWSFTLLVCLAAIAASILVYLLFEKPVTALIRKLMKRRRPQPQTA